MEEPTAWLLALLFCAFAAAPNLVVPGEFSPAVRAFMFAFRAAFLGMLFPFFNLFFSVFPRPSPLDRRFPWLKWAGLVLGACIFIPGLQAGHPSLPRVVVRLLGTRGADVIVLFVMYPFLALGLISLVQNSFTAAIPPEARRKSRVILWGTVVGVLPIALERMVVDFTNHGSEERSGGRIW